MIFLLYGKRKSGKDHFANLINKNYSGINLGRISEPLKSEYAKQHNLDLEKLLGDGPYKETYRNDMVKWGEEMRKTDAGYFCGKIREDVNFVTDCRRMSDIQYFRDNFSDVKLLKITASECTRKSRGWIYTEGIDDAETECGLDWLVPDVVIRNDYQTDSELLGQFESLNSGRFCLNKCVESDK